MEILLCHKCFNLQNYFIPMKFKFNKEIKYVCPFYHKIDKENTFNVHSSNIMKKLRFCSKHEKENYCGWCKDCKINICFKCSISGHKGHNHILFTQFVKFILYNKESFIQKNKDLKNLIEEYYKTNININEELIALNEIILYNKVLLNLFFEEEIINYQIIKNLVINIKDISNNYKKYKLMILHKDDYKYFIPFIKNIKQKQYWKINQSQITIPFLSENTTLIPLNCELYDDEKNKNDIGFYKNENAFLLYYYSENILRFYNMSGMKLFDDITLNNSFIYNSENDIIQILQYKTNILLLFYSFKIVFLILYPDLISYDFTNEFSLKVKESDNYISAIKPIFPFFNKRKIIKMSEDTVTILNKNNFYYIKLDKNIYYIDNFQERVINMELVQSGIVDMVPIYNTELNRKGVEEIITLNVFGELDQKSKDLFSLLITIFSKDCKIIKFFKINLKKEHNAQLFNEKSDLEIAYSFTNKSLLLFFFNSIYQVNCRTEEITTIYDFNINKENNGLINSTKFKIIKKIYYDKDLKEIKELILVHNKSENLVYPFFFDEKILKSSEPFYLPNFVDLVEFNYFNASTLPYYNNIQSIIIDKEFLRLLN